MERYLQSLAFFVLAGVLIVLMALMAVPYIYSGNDIKQYIETNVVIPGGKKIKINSDVDFSVFPKIHLEIEDADVIDRIGFRNKIKNFEASLGFFDVFTGHMRIKYNGFLNSTAFKGKLTIQDYYAMQKREETDFKLRLDTPFVIELTGKFQLKENEIALRDYNMYHRSTRISGDLILTRLNDTEFNLINHISIVSDNLEDLRHLRNPALINEPYAVLEGSGRMNFTFSAKGDSVFALKRNLTGQGSIRIKDAKINGYDLEEIAKNPFSIKFLPDEGRTIPVDSVTGVFSVLNGIISTADFSIKSKKANLVSSGSYDIAAEKIDIALNLNADLSDSRINLPLIIRGDIRAPRVIGNYNNAVAASSTGEEPTEAEAAEMRQNLENLTSIVNEKISQSLATDPAAANLTGQDTNNGILSDILPWRANTNIPASVKPARIVTPQEEDKLIGNWGAPAPAKPALTPAQLYEQQQLNKARQPTLQPAVLPSGAAITDTPATPATGGLYVTQPTPADGNIEEPLEEPVSDVDNDVTVPQPVEP